MEARAARRDRAARMGVEPFLLERAFGDCLERIEMLGHRTDRSLLLGCPDPSWPRRLGQFATDVMAADPGPLFARTAQAELVVEDEWASLPQGFGLICTLGTLDTVNALPLALRLLAAALEPGGLLIGVMSGGETLPLLRRALAAADLAAGAASAHVHPRIEATALAQ